MTLLCGEDGRWNPDPQTLCTGKQLYTWDFIANPENNLSTSAVIAITAVVCLLVALELHVCGDCSCI